MEFGTGTLRLGLRTDLLQALGELITNFAVLEAQLSLLVQEVLQVPPARGPIITAPLSFRVKREILGALLTEEKKPLTTEEIGQFVSRLQKAESERNRFIHSTYAAWIADDRVARIKDGIRKHAYVATIESEFDVTEVKNAAEFISVVLADMQLLLRLVEGAPSEEEPEQD